MTTPMRYLVPVVLGTFSLAVTVPAQNPSLPVYQGYQPDLVNGIEDGFATDQPKIRHVFLADPSTIGVVVDAQAIPIEPMIPYKKEPGDEIRPAGVMKIGRDQRDAPRYRNVFRDGEEIGSLIGPKDEYLLPKPRLEGEPLDVAEAESPASYALRSPDDARYSSPTAPTEVFRKSLPEMKEYVRNGAEERTTRHTLFLRLPQPLEPGKRYELAFPGNAQFAKPVAFTFNDRALRTEAIHVNLLGYHPDQNEKIALLSMWLGTGGDANLSDLKEFEVVDDKSGRSVFKGPIKLRKEATPGKKTAILPATESDPADLPMSVYEVDFSAVKDPGVYRVVVPGLGSSFPFRIDDSVWQDAARYSALGFLNHRSGIELGPPHTDFKRPRAMHPADGFVVHRTDPELFFDPERFPGRTGNAFKRIQASILEDTKVPEAWGGWHDAADFDRSILPQNHPAAVHVMLDLFESNPAYFSKLNLNLPESGNAVPDIVDEALWCMELFRRLQQPDGGVPSSVESIEHPSSAPSFLETLPTAITPPTPQSNFIYAAAAAHMAYVLANSDPRLAAAYRTSALRAMEWADKNDDVPNIYERPDLRPVSEDESHAAAHLYRLTGDQKWHERFKKTLGDLYPEGLAGADRLYMENRYDSLRGLGVYALLPADKADPELQAAARKLLVAAADRQVNAIATWPMGMNPMPSHWGQRGEQPTELVVAHRLTGDQKYLDALIRTSQPSMGANPANASYTWGMGARHVRAYQIDPNRTGTPFPVGVTTYGFFPRYIWGAKSVEDNLGAAIHPAWENWPAPESIFNHRHAHATEYAIGILARYLHSRGYLAQAFGSPETQPDPPMAAGQ